MLNLAATFPTQTTPPDAAFPSGGPRDVSSPGAGDGTPKTAATTKDEIAWQQFLVHRAGLTPSNTPDTVLSGQVIEALFLTVGAAIETFTAALVRDCNSIGDFRTRGYATVGDGGESAWMRTGGPAGTPSTVNWATGLFYDAKGREFALTNPELSFEMNGLVYVDILALQAATGRPINLRAGATYALGATGLSLGTGTIIRGPGLSAATVAEAAVFTYAGAGASYAITVAGNECDLSNFRINCTSGQGLKIASSSRNFLRGIEVSTPGTNMILVENGTDNVLENCRFIKPVGFGTNAIQITGSTNTISRGNYFYIPVGEGLTCTDIDALTSFTKISGYSYSGANLTPPIVNAGNYTTFEDGYWHKSPHFSLSGGTVQGASDIDRAGFINRIRVTYAGGMPTGATPCAIDVGKAVGGVLTLSYFFNGSTTPAVNYISEDKTPAANVLGNGEMLVFTTDGGSESGEMDIAVEILPYRGLV